MKKGKKGQIKRIEFTQEGENVVFFPVDSQFGWDIGEAHFEGFTEFEATAGCCIVKTHSLQEMGFSLEIEPPIARPN
jgi:hypothetical protein